MELGLSGDGVDREALRLAAASQLAYATPVREYPGLADRKASTLMGLNALMIAILTTFSHRLGEAVIGDSFHSRLGLAALTLWFASALVSAYFGFATMTLPIPTMPESLVYFRHIQPLDRTEYHRRVRTLAHADAIRHMLDYNYSLATLSAAKFARVNLCALSVCVAFFFWTVVMVFLAFAR